MSEFETGQVFHVPYPFVRETFTEYVDSGEMDGGGYPIHTAIETPSWRPGIDYEIVGPEGEADAVSDGLGLMVLAVVSVHKPGHFPERIFYTRKFRDPDGKEFGKGGCRICVVSKFRRLTQGYRHEFRPRSDRAKV